MNRIIIPVLIFLFSFCIDSQATLKVYLIHGYAGNGMELNKIQRSLKRNGYVYENFTYNSFKQEVDSVSKLLFSKIQQDGYDTISFVTHSMGALIFRALHKHLDSTVAFPNIHRIVMIAPPNQGTPVADYYSQFEIISKLAGPNIHNLTTDSLTGSRRYPIPNCEIGIIVGNINKKKGYTVPLAGQNDGLIPAESSILGTENDIRYIKATHVSILFKRKVIRYVVDFLKNGNFG